VVILPYRLTPRCPAITQAFVRRVPAFAGALAAYRCFSGVGACCAMLPGRMPALYLLDVIAHGGSSLLRILTCTCNGRIACRLPPLRARATALDVPGFPLLCITYGGAFCHYYLFFFSSLLSFLPTSPIGLVDHHTFLYTLLPPYCLMVPLYLCLFVQCRATLPSGPVPACLHPACLPYILYYTCPFYYMLWTVCYSAD